MNTKPILEPGGPELPPGGEADATMAAPPIAGANSADPAATRIVDDDQDELETAAPSPGLGRLE